MNIFNVITKNLAGGPDTLRFPARYAPQPKFRGAVTNDAGVCVCCGICQRVCPSGAIEVTHPNAGCHWRYDLGACTFCGRCEDHCPVSAITQLEDRPAVYGVARELSAVVIVAPAICGECGAERRPLNLKTLERAYGTVTPELIARMSLCPACRSKASAERVHDASLAAAAAAAPATDAAAAAAPDAVSVPEASAEPDAAAEPEAIPASDAPPVVPDGDPDAKGGAS